ncbi:LacI family transcriptional regulator [Actinomyces sp. B33]|uniref:LacI family DNA-binding transcriptional regulator n=1 Tax=Actinomyces sp. B33 TaxID=2942131 RepID=UPI0023414DF2|nr:LacI family DNA-binding transcriptional regulator [Actinomyces sp. B33]MDC4233673.1 LacI family transcriptional regulator [Actinomyces sp. B33]
MTPSAPRGRIAPAPSIEDVARLAGVSAQTVSRVSRDAPNVRPTTRQRVLDAMNQLGYAPNRAARALRSGTFRTIGVITQNPERTGENLITAGIASAAESRGYSVALMRVSHPETGDLQEAGVRLGQQTIDGLIIVQAGGADRGSLLLPTSLPVVVSDSRLINDYPSVVADQDRGVRDVMAHLISLGHRSIAHIAGPDDSRSALQRAAAWRSCLHEAGLPEGPLLPGDWSAHSGYRAGLRLVDEHPGATAVLCANDESAFGAIRALHERHRRVPDDVSVTGFDGIPLSEFCSPPLTTAHLDFPAIGAGLVDLLLSRIGSPAPSLERRIVPASLVVRDSTGPAPSR